jgi:hypothetical protein
MLPEDIDDLFRSSLGDHSSPPPAADALFGRLQQAADKARKQEERLQEKQQAERLDALFLTTLQTHPTPPSRELWERLEDEHLRPRQRRAAAWWPLALAAAVALLIVASGGFFLRGRLGGPASPAVATHSSRPAGGTAAQPQPQTEVAALAAHTPQAPALNPSRADSQKNSAAQATRPAALASSAPKAEATNLGPRPGYSQSKYRQPDAATQLAATVARAATHPVPAPAADEQRPPAPALAQAPTPKVTPEALLTPASAILASAEVIVVDVRPAAEPTVRPAKAFSNGVAAVTAAAEAPDARFPLRLGGRLLQQASHLVRGERLSLAEVTGLPETVTVQARLGSRTISKSIQL